MRVNCPEEAGKRFCQPEDMWFPDFWEVLEEAEDRYARNPERFGGMMAVAGYFRGKYPPEDFAARFLAAEQPAKMLRRDREQYLQIQAICAAFQEKNLEKSEFDRTLAALFGGRPQEDVFSPPMDRREEIRALIDRLEQEKRVLPIQFDFVNWKGYLSGRLTRREFTQWYRGLKAWEQLEAFLNEPGDKEEFRIRYARKIAVCAGLNTLCVRFQNGEADPAAFDTEYLALAYRFAE